MLDELVGVAARMVRLDPRSGTGGMEGGEREGGRGKGAGRGERGGGATAGSKHPPGFGGQRHSSKMFRNKLCGVILCEDGWA